MTNQEMQKQAATTAMLRKALFLLREAVAFGEFHGRYPEEVKEHIKAFAASDDALAFGRNHGFYK